MKMSDKIIELRKSNGMTQESLAEKLDVSRQAISRWESGSAMPDAGNILQLSKLFGVTTDYLLHDEYLSDNDIPKIQEVQKDYSGQIMFYLIVMEIMVLLIQFMTTFILQSIPFALLSFILFLASIAGFELGYRRHMSEATEKVCQFRWRFYKISAWLGLYFPIRFLMNIVSVFCPWNFSVLVFEIIILAVYMMTAVCVSLSIDKHHILG